MMISVAFGVFLLFQTGSVAEEYTCIVQNQVEIVRSEGGLESVARNEVLDVYILTQTGDGPNWAVTRQSDGEDIYDCRPGDIRVQAPGGGSLQSLMPSYLTCGGASGLHVDLRSGLFIEVSYRDYIQELTTADGVAFMRSGVCFSTTGQRNAPG